MFLICFGSFCLGFMFACVSYGICDDIGKLRKMKKINKKLESLQQEDRR